MNQEDMEFVAAFRTLMLGDASLDDKVVAFSRMNPKAHTSAIFFAMTDPQVDRVARKFFEDVSDLFIQNRSHFDVLAARSKEPV